MRAMGPELGEVFHHLMQDAARLHLKWNEFDAIFSGSDQIKRLNRSASGFFWLVQNAWWNDMLLQICRMTDDGTDVLSVRRLSKLVKVALRDEIKARLQKIDRATVAVRDLRDRYIAHRNIDDVLERSVRPLPDPDRTTVLNAIRTIDELLHFVDHHFTRSGPILYDYLDILGGADSILDIVDRGLRDRDRQLGFDPK